MQVKKRNRNAGKSTGKSDSAKYFSANPEARKKKNEYNKKYHSTKKRKKYRAELNSYNKKKGTYGNGDGKDASHSGSKIVRFEGQSKNRARK
jgi:hypothetical protein